jgi:ATP-dependent Clp protease ATP-binding subunit ClpA
MFERFTQDARQIVVRAQEEARTLHHSFIGTEHLLLGLLGGQGDPARLALSASGLELGRVRARFAELIGDAELDSEALAVFGIDLEQVRRATEASFGPGALDAQHRRPEPHGHIPFTRRAKKVLELSLREATRLGHDSIGTGHLLLGMIRDGDGLAVKLMLDSGVELDALRDEVTRLMGGVASS